MTRKNNQRKQMKSATRRLNNMTVSRPKPKTPFRDVGGIIGRAAGNITGFQGAQGVGKWLGTGIGSIFGSGDYDIVGPSSAYNVLAGSPPKFSSTAATNIVCHREYLGDIVGTGAFNNGSYPINPGMSKTFPWLSTIAQNYQEYRFHGLVFEFKSLLTDFVTGGTPGVVVMATNYNSGAIDYTTKQQMENSEFAVSVKPTRDMLHMIECERNLTVLPHSYVRVGPVPAGQDIRLYDQGKFQFATQGNPTVGLGELWVTYCVEFIKPTTVTTQGPVNQNMKFAHIMRVNTSTTAPMGVIGNFADVGNMIIDFSPTGLSYTGVAGQYMQYDFYWQGTTNSSIQNYPFTLANSVAVNGFNNRTYNSIRGLTTPATDSTLILSMVVIVTNDGFTGINFGSGIVPTNANLDVVISRLPTF